MVCLLLVVCLLGLLFAFVVIANGQRPKDLKNDTILITGKLFNLPNTFTLGAAHGLGRLIALNLAEYCPNIIGLDINMTELNETAALVYKQTQVKMSCYQCDLR